MVSAMSTTNKVGSNADEGDTLTNKQLQNFNTKQQQLAKSGTFTFQNTMPPENAPDWTGQGAGMTDNSTETDKMLCPGRVVLSCDIGSRNFAYTLFSAQDSQNKKKNVKQTILQMGIWPLLPQGSWRVTTTAYVKRRLDALVKHMKDGGLQEDYWVLIEYQPHDRQSRIGRLFNIQLQQCVAMYFIMRGKQVRTIDPRKRYTFLEVKQWSKLSRYHRKKRVVDAVADMFNQPPGDTLLHLSAEARKTWDEAGKKDDLADSFAQLLPFFYHTKVLAKSGNLADTEKTSYLALQYKSKKRPLDPGGPSKLGKEQDPHKLAKQIRNSIKNKRAREIYQQFGGESPSLAQLLFRYQDNRDFQSQIMDLKALINSPLDSVDAWQQWLNKRINHARTSAPN